MAEDDSSRTICHWLQEQAAQQQQQQAAAAQQQRQHQMQLQQVSGNSCGMLLVSAN